MNLLEKIIIRIINIIGYTMIAISLMIFAIIYWLLFT